MIPEKLSIPFEVEKKQEPAIVKNVVRTDILFSSNTLLCQKTEIYDMNKHFSYTNVFCKSCKKLNFCSFFDFFLSCSKCAQYTTFSIEA